MPLTNNDKNPAQSLSESSSLQNEAEEATQSSIAHDHEKVHDHCCCGHDHDHAEKEHDHCCCGHDHEHAEKEHDHCCCGHDNEHAEKEHDHCCCGHDHGQAKKEHDHCCCGHNHEHAEKAHDHCRGHDHGGHDHGHCGCGHDHSHVENSMDTDWDVSGVTPDQYRLLFSVLGGLAGVKDVGLNPDGLRIIHTPEALPSIEKAFQANGLKLKRNVDQTKETSQIHIAQMDCPTEEGLIRQKLGKMKGVGGLQFNLMNRVLTVSYPPGTLPEILAAIRSLDYTPEVIDGKKTQALSEFKPTQIPWWRYILAIVVAAGSEVSELLGVNEYLTLALAIIAIVMVGLGTYKKGIIAIRNFNFNMNALMSVAVTGALIIGSWPEAAMVMVLFELSEAIEQLSLDKARGAIRSLLSLAPQTANVLKNGKVVEIPANEVKVGDELRVMPGERLAVDGVVVKGSTSIDQSPITGESMPVEKNPGDQVFAGTINKNGEILYRAESSVADSMPSRIISAIESAQSSRAPTQRFVDKFAKIYTPTVFVIALFCAIVPPLFFQQGWLEWIYKGLTLLVIACPCALVISTPVTIVSGLAAAARRGILIKGGVYLEKGRTLKSVAFDKTGTLTKGKPSVLVYETADLNADSAVILKLAAALAYRNDHPVSKAVAELAASKAIPREDVSEVHGFFAVPGQGVVGEIDGTEYYLGNIKGLDRYLLQSQMVRDKVSVLANNGCSPLILASSKKVLAYFGVADSIKETSPEALKSLKELGIKTIMLTGDNDKAAKAVGSKVGVDRVKGNLLPEEKQQLVQQIAKKEPVGMVGDGINDAPALARADIGFAMGAAGTDTAIETADVALMDDDLRKLPEFIRLSKRTYALLMQNIAIALGIKFVFFILTLVGIGTMWMAVFADTGTCLIVVANGMRMLRWRG